MGDILTALWLAMQDTPPADREDDDDDDEGGGGLAVPTQPRPHKWPPRIRLFLPRPLQPVPVPVGAS